MTNTFAIRAASDNFALFVEMVSDRLAWFKNREGPGLMKDPQFLFLVHGAAEALRQMKATGLLNDGERFGTGGCSMDSIDAGGYAFNRREFNNKYMLNEELADESVVYKAFTTGVNAGWNKAKKLGNINYPMPLCLERHAGIGAFLVDSRFSRYVGKMNPVLTLQIEGRQLLLRGESYSRRA